MNKFLVLAIAITATNIGCSSTKPSSGCVSASDCIAGETCIEGTCRQLCASDSECLDGEICEDQLCTTGARDAAPTISGIDGDGVPDGETDHAAHRTAGSLIIDGTNLGGVEVFMADGATSWPLVICDNTGEQVTALLPEGLSSGATYELTVVNQAGSCSAPLPVLQGEVGPQGPAGAAGIAGAPGTPGIDGRSGSLVLQLELDEASGTTFADSSGFGHNATAPVAGIAPGSGGHTDRAVAFSGGVIQVPTGNTIPDSAQIWVEAWILPALPINVTRTIVSKVGSYSLKQANDHILFTVEAGLGTCTVTSASPITAGEWFHVSGSYNGLTIDVAVNGRNTFVSCTNGPIASSAGGELQVGGLMDSSQNITEDYNGRIDEVRVRHIAPPSSHARVLYHQWGTSSCTSPHATELYAGWVYGDYHNHGGGSNDMLCLEDGDPGDAGTYQGDILYATNINGGATAHMGNIEDDKRMHCAACTVPAGICFQKNGSHSCPSGYTAEYTGYLYGSHYGHNAKYERLCVDHLNFDNSTDNSPNTGGHVYPTRTESTGGSAVQVTRYVRCAICCGY